MKSSSLADQLHWLKFLLMIPSSMMLLTNLNLSHLKLTQEKENSNLSSLRVSISSMSRDGILPIILELFLLKILRCSMMILLFKEAKLSKITDISTISASQIILMSNRALPLDCNSNMLVPKQELLLMLNNMLMMKFNHIMLNSLTLLHSLVKRLINNPSKLTSIFMEENYMRNTIM